jgi:hypothetical protein
MNAIPGIEKLREMTFTIERYLGAALFLALFSPSCMSQPQAIGTNDIKLLGSLDYGQTSAPARLAAKPPYSAYAFNAKPGDQIEITVQGQGSLQAILTNAEYRKLAGGSTHFSYTFDPALQPGTYYILVSEAQHRTSSFTVDLERPSRITSAPNYLSCSVDADCVAVDRAGCCHNGYKDAVNASQVEAYRAANACKEAHHMCPMFMILDKRVARCNTTLKRCEMVQPQEGHP